MSDRIGKSRCNPLPAPEVSLHIKLEEFMSLKLFKKLKSLLMKSAIIQLEIDEESRRKNPDWVRVLTLKKQRLIIKDSLQRLRQRPKNLSYNR
jgi:hypothetical protein